MSEGEAQEVAVLEAPKAPSFPLQQPQSEVPLKKPSEVVILRRELGLADESSLLDSQTAKEEREKRLEDFVKEKEEMFFVSRKQGFIDHSKREEEKETSTPRRLSRLEQIDRAVTKKIMQVRGVANPEQLIASLEELFPYLDYSVLRDKKAIEGLSGMPDVGLAIRRVFDLGYHLYGEAFKLGEMIDSLKVMASLSEEDYIRIKNDLNRYFFLSKSVSAATSSEYKGKKFYLSADFKAVVDILRNNGLTPEQREALENAYQFALLIDGVPIRGADGKIDTRWIDYISFDMIFNQGLGPQQAKDLLFLTRDFASRLLPEDPSLPPSREREKISSSFLKNLGSLLASGEARGLIDLAKRGWSCRSLYDDINSYDFGVRKEKIENGLQKTVAFVSDADRVGWATLFSELLGYEGLGSGSLFIDFYEQMYEKRDFLTGLALLAKDLRVDFKDLFWERELEEGKIEINKYFLGELLINEKSENHPPEEQEFWNYIRLNQFLVSPGYGSKLVVDEKELELLSYLVRNKGRFQGLFSREQYEGLIPRARLIEEVLSQKVPLSPRRLEKLMLQCGDLENLPPRLIIDNLSLIDPQGLPGVISRIPANFFEELPAPERLFWAFFKGQNRGIQQFLLGKPRDFYLASKGVDENAVMRDYINELRATPENCRTYEALTTLFNDLYNNHPRGDEMAMIYLKIAAAHRFRTIGQRTEVEALEGLKQSFSALYHPQMSAFEKLAWKILQRQLPFTANEETRNNMRNKAVEVEQLDSVRLSWVHQSVHNYASLFEVSYLNAFRDFLKTGDKTELSRIREMFRGDSQAPDYTEEDRQRLLSRQNLPEELDRLIELTSLFYEIRPETLEAAGLARVPNEFFRTSGFLESLQSLAEDLLILKKETMITSVQEKEAAVRFCLTASNLRKTIFEKLATPEFSLESKQYALILDAVLDDLSQAILTRYKDYLYANKDKLTSKDLVEATGMLGGLLLAGYYNGEVAEDAYQDATRLLDFADPTKVVTSGLLHRTLLFFPILKQKHIDSYWQRFNDAAKPEMVKMLVRAGLPEKEAEERVLVTDLVEFRKSSAAFLLDPFIKVVEEGLSQMEREGKGETSNVREVYKEILGGKVLEGERSNPEVMSFIKNLSKRRMPDNLAEVDKFLVVLARSPEADVEKLARLFVRGYLDSEKLARKYTKVEKNGRTIEFYPLSFYGVDMVVILENGKRVENPKEFFIKNFQVPPAALHYLREGD